MGKGAVILGSSVKVTGAIIEQLVESHTDKNLILYTPGSIINENDPEFNTWDKKTGILITQFQVRDGITTFASILSYIGATEKTLIVDSTQIISEDTIIPVTLSLQIRRGGSLTISTGKTLTINSSFEAGLYQIFDCIGTGKIVFGMGSVNMILPEWFGALADDTTDSTIGIQTAIDCSYNSGVGRMFPTVKLSYGRYYITAPILMNYSGHYFNLEGASENGDATILYTDQAIASMLVMGANAVVTSLHIIKGIQFIGTTVTDCIIDARYDRYYTIKGCIFKSVADGAWFIKGGWWVTRIEDCDFNPGSTSLMNGVYLTTNLNNVIIEKNNFAFLNVAIQMTYATQVEITKNTIDGCGTGVIIDRYARGLSIHHNYFETTGSTAVDGFTELGGAITLYGPIIINRIDSAIVPINNSVTIYDNQFANCSQTAPAGRICLVSLKTIKNFHMYDNYVFDTYGYDHVVYLHDEGSGYTINSRVIIDQDLGSSSDPLLNISSALNIDAILSDSYLSGIIIRRNTIKGWPKTILPDVLAFDTPVITKAGVYNGLPYYTMVANTEDQIVFEVDPSLVGKWYRLSKFWSRGVGEANSINVFVYYSTNGADYTTIFNRYLSSSLTWTVNAKDLIFQIPTATTHMKIRIDTAVSSPGNTVEFGNLDLEAAYLEIN